MDCLETCLNVDTQYRIWLLCDYGHFQQFINYIMRTISKWLEKNQN
jgi:hypothetical protein